MQNKTEIVISIVRQIDAAEAERATLDGRISGLKAQLDAIVGGAPRQKQGALPKPAVGSRGAKSARLLALLSENPEVDHEALSTKFYGDASPKSRNKIRALLFQLKQKGKIRSGTNGWEVLQVTK